MGETSTANEAGTTRLKTGEGLKIIECQESGNRTQRYVVSDRGIRTRFDGHKVPMIIQLETFNRLEQVGERRVVKGGVAHIYTLDSPVFPVYSLEFSDMVDGLRMTEEAVKKLLEFRVVDEWTRAEVCDKIMNRRVFYWNQQAIIIAFDGEKGLVTLEADGDQHLLTPYESLPGKTLEEDLLLPLIYWWRSE